MVGAAWIGRDGRGPHLWNAVVESAVHRTRRVELTAAATVHGSGGSGSEGIEGGPTLATVVTLIFVPALYAARFKVARTTAPAAAATPAAHH